VVFVDGADTDVVTHPARSPAANNVVRPKWNLFTTRGYDQTPSNQSR
jgi:hypothetical protein